MSPPPLTPRERDVLALVRDGCTNREVGARLGIREDTVKKVVRNAGWKYGTGDRIAIVLAAIRAGEIAL